MTSTNDMQPPFAKLGTRALVVLTLINMFNYIDRYVGPPWFESLRKDQVMGHPRDAQLGGLITAFSRAMRSGWGLGGVLGGSVGAHFGGRAACFVPAVPGRLLALLALTVPDPPRAMWDVAPRANPDPVQAKPAFALDSYGTLGRN